MFWGKVRRHRQWPRSGISFFLVAVALGVGLSSCSTGSDAVEQGSTFEFVSPGGQTHVFYEPDQRRQVPALSGPSVTDPRSTLSLSDFAGKVVVLNLWGSWCAPCRTETYALERVAATLTQDVQLLGLNVRDEQSAAADFMKNYNVTYPSIFDPSGRVGLQLRGIPLAAVPVTLIIDRNRAVAAVYIGAILDTDIEPALAKVLAEH